MAIFKLCPECGEKIPEKATVCEHCGYDEACACCILYGSRDCEPDCLHLDIYSALDWDERRMRGGE